MINGDTLSGNLATLATRTSPPGQYSITQGTPMASANYALIFNPGTLAVEAVLVMPAGTSASIVADCDGKAFYMGRFVGLPPFTSDGRLIADGSTSLIGDHRGNTVVCFGGGGGAAPLLFSSCVNGATN